MTREHAISQLKSCIGMNNREICDYLGYPGDGAWCLAGVVWFFETKLNIKLPISTLTKEVHHAAYRTGLSA